MNRDSYFIDEAENDMGRCLVLKAPWSDNFIEIIRKEDISILRLSESMGWKGKDIFFLENIKDVGLRGVEVYAWNVKDISPLKFMEGLEYLSIQCNFTKAPDFSCFNRLKICKLLWRPKARTVFDCTGLRFLNVINYPDADLMNLKSMTDMRRLQITSKNLVSLAGIQSLNGLKILDLADCPKLESLAGIEKCQEIQEVDLERCKKVMDISSLGKIASLRDVALTDCGKIKSLRPLSNCRLLECLTFAGDTNVEDGDLTPLLDIPELKKLWFFDKRHYTHKRDQVAAILSLRKGSL